MAENTRSMVHPHPPATDILDSEGRCLWCSDRAEIAALRAELEQTKQDLSVALSRWNSSLTLWHDARNQRDEIAGRFDDVNARRRHYKAELDAAIERAEAAERRNDAFVRALGVLIYLREHEQRFSRWPWRYAEAAHAALDGLYVQAQEENQLGRTGG